MKRLLLTILCVLSLAASSWATTYSGSLTSIIGGGLFATEDWAGGTSVPNSSLSWVVNDIDNPGYWTYDYSWTGTRKALSHIIIEVSETFTTDNIISISAGADPDAPKIYGPDDPSNDGIPGDVFGIKWDANSTAFIFEIVTDRAPMWGDVYARDGKTGGNEVFAYSTGFGFDTLADIGNGNAMDVTNGRAWALVPDTNGGGGGGGGSQVPEPGTMLLLGAGLFGLAIYGRRKMVK